MTNLRPARKKVKALTNPVPGERPLGDVLREAHRALVVHLEHAIGQAGYDDVGAPHVSVLATVDPNGTRLVDLAARGGRTKQATAELCAALVRRGYVELQPDPTDGRAKLYVVTADGGRLLRACRDVVVDYDSWLQGLVGAEAIAQLRSILATIIERPVGE
ncbi:MarR family winged helix-turn-helix transcriptional regulator [Kribbella sp. NPDC051587]|uniref:MarR family winged helix-turn-helix transcriptional regulator n=1 Tax=Kribbella sp. NPDC051587 TaxID=3364119 RepID=UPI0037B13201